MSQDSDDEYLPNFEEVESMFKVDYNGLTLYGEGLPPLEEIKVSHREAWRICKLGSLCVFRNFSDSRALNLTYNAVCDGSDPVNFLLLYPSDKEKKHHVISFWELLNAYWVWKKCRLFYIPDNQSEKSSNPMVIEGLSPSFYEALFNECNEMIKRTKVKLSELDK